MNKIIVALLTVCSLIGAVSAGDTVGALAGFSPGRIVDDTIFTNDNSMTPAQIQTFLNSKVPTCDTYGTKPSGYGNTRAQWAYAKYGESTFTCLKDYNEGGRTAAQIIYDTGKAYRINPQVLIVLLQKEQGLVTDDWPVNNQYKTATGYGCPDSGPNYSANCNASYYGFTNQVGWAAKMFRAILNNSPSWYTPYVLGNNFIQYDTDPSCGGSTVNIQNRSTQALYNYTPYQPSNAALAAGYGSAEPCGAYGNRNFFLYFRDWFGSPTGATYSWNLTSFGVYSDSSLSRRIDTDGGVYMTPGQKAYVKVAAKNTGVSVWSRNTLKIGTVAPNPLLRDSSWIHQDRAAYLTENSVSYDGTGTFTFAITAPNQVGNYYQNYNLVIDGLTWFDSPGLTLLGKTVNPVPSVPFTDNSMLPSGATLSPGQTVYSPDGGSSLSFVAGEVLFYSNLRLVWSTKSAGSAANRFVNQSDGNLVLYSSTGQALWSSNTDGRGASNLKVQSDGNLVHYTANANSPVWTTNTSSPTDETIRVNDMIGTDYALFRGQTAQSLDRKYRFTLQSDGNLVLYNASNRPIWASNTDGRGGHHFTLQSDGNLVLYNASNRPIWASNTDGRGPSTLIVQTDGNVVLYSGTGASWVSHTTGR